MRIELTEDQFQKLADVAKETGTTIADVARQRIIGYPTAEHTAILLHEQGLLLSKLVTAMAARKR